MSHQGELIICVIKANLSYASSRQTYHMRHQGVLIICVIKANLDTNWKLIDSKTAMEASVPAKKDTIFIRPHCRIESTLALNNSIISIENIFYFDSR